MDHGPVDAIVAIGWTGDGRQITYWRDGPYMLHTLTPPDWINGSVAPSPWPILTCSAIGQQDPRLLLQAFTIRGIAIPVHRDLYHRPGGPDDGPRAFGLQSDLILDPDTPPELHIAFEPSLQYVNVPPLLPPPGDVVVQARLQTGPGSFIEWSRNGTDALDGGPVLAEGRSEPALLHPTLLGEHPHVTFHEWGDRHVYAFRFPLQVLDRIATEEENANLRIDVYLDNPVCHEGDPPSDGHVMTSLGVHYSPGLHPRISMGLQDALVGLRLEPRLDGGDLHVRFEATSPFGAYDVVAGNLTVRQEGGDAAWQADLERWSDAGPHLVASYRLRDWLEQAAAGGYVVTVEASSLQGSASLTGHAWVDTAGSRILLDGQEVVEEHAAPDEEASAVLLPWLVALLGTAAVVRRGVVTQVVRGPAG